MDSTTDATADRHPGPQPEDLLRRLRAWSVSSWRHGDRAAAAREALQRMADRGAAAAGREPVPVPVLGSHALVDQLVVVSAQCRADGADPTPDLLALARALGFSRP